MLANLLRQPACGKNLALRQPGKCSSSCGVNESSPASANDNDLRQYGPYVWLSCPTDKRPWWAVQLPEEVANPYVRLLLGDCCADEDQTTISVYIGDKAGPAAGARLCNSLWVDDGSATGTFCEGTGSWITITSDRQFSIAEVQVCEGISVNPLFRHRIAGSVDTGAGLIEIFDQGTRVAQATPSLLALSAAGRNAPWRLPTPAETIDLATIATLLVVGVVGVICVLAMLHTCRNFITGQADDKKTRFSRVSGSEVVQVPLWEGTNDDNEDSVEILVGPDEPEEETGGVEVCFETTDGKTLNTNLHLSEVTGVQQVLETVKAAAANSLRMRINHVSLQYVDTATGRTEQAWYDPVLGEGSELNGLMRSRHWRVLVLGADENKQMPEQSGATASIPEALKVDTPGANVPPMDVTSELMCAAIPDYMPPMDVISQPLPAAENHLPVERI